MEKNLEKLFAELEGTFDIEMPETGHAARFLEKLDAPKDKHGGVSKAKNSWRRTFAIAASIAVLFTVGLVAVQSGPSAKDQLAEISPEAANTEFYFASLIEEQVKVLQEESTPETKAMVDDTMLQLRKLENDYNTLEKDLLEGGNSKLILSAMITNFQTRIDLLQEVLDKIDTIKILKQTIDENYSI